MPTVCMPTVCMNTVYMSTVCMPTVCITVTDLANSCATLLFRRPQGSLGRLEKQTHPLKENLVVWSAKIEPKTNKV